MRRVKGFRIAAAVVLTLAAAGVAEAQQRTPPYWASVAAGKARMRTGPGRQFPATWLYVRSGLPIRVIASVPNWRRVEDPDGEKGWVQANLLSERRTAIVRGGIQPLRTAPQEDASIAWRVEPGVVGRISRCGDGWCRLDVAGRGGFISTDHIWGVSTGETVP
ncbi:SH3-like domain-containing protein [Sphingomonas zeicaulis]|uniref:SH3 domain-containing protein n=1 Tax=Sphingomonas zeicaulis TaxID=1632740 RepID=UPI003D1F5B3C